MGFLLAIDVTSSGSAEEKLKWAFRMYDVDGNGVIDQDEMTKIVQAIYDMLGAGATKPTDSAEECAKNIFSRMDENGDGHLTEEEFLRGCLQDDELSQMWSNNFFKKQKQKNKNPEASLLLYSYTIFSSIDPKYPPTPTITSAFPRLRLLDVYIISHSHYSKENNITLILFSFG